MTIAYSSDAIKRNRGDNGLPCLVDLDSKMGKKNTEVIQFVCIEAFGLLYNIQIQLKNPGPGAEPVEGIFHQKLSP